MDKKAYRQKALSQRRQMTSEERSKESQLIAEQILTSSWFQSAKSVFVYVSEADEVATDSLLAAVLEAGKILCVPFITNTKESLMVAARLRDVSQLEPGKFCIRTVPANQVEEVLPAEIDLVIVPGVAFDKAGHRIGLGGGYYDRFLGQCITAKRLAPAYTCQLFDQVPVEVHDQKVDAVCTGNHIFFS